MSAVYFARVGDFVKIGLSSNPTQRMKTLLNSKRLICPDGLDRSLAPDLVMVIPFCRMRDERNLQLLFGNHWVVGEWYRWSPAFEYQMRTMTFVTHAVRLKHLAQVRRELGLVGGSPWKELHGGQTVTEFLSRRVAA